MCLFIEEMMFELRPNEQGVTCEEGAAGEQRWRRSVQAEETLREQALWWPAEQAEE